MKDREKQIINLAKKGWQVRRINYKTWRINGVIDLYPESGTYKHLITDQVGQYPHE